MVGFQEELMKLEGDLRDVNTNRQQLRANFLELKELQVVLNASHHFLEEVRADFEGLVFGIDPSEWRAY